MMTLALLLLLQPQQATAPIRTTTRMVEVSVVATDKAGRRIANLAKEDFVLSDDGKKQEIRVFRAEAGETKAAPRESLPAGYFSNRLEYGGIPNSATVVLVDSLNTPPGYWAQARPQLAQFLRRLDPRFRAGIYVLDVAGLRVLHDFTADSSALMQELEKLKAGIPAEALKDFIAAREHGRAQVSADEGESYHGGPESVLFGQGDPSHLIAAIVAHGEKLSSGHIRADRIRTTLAALSAIANRLKGVPGRKNLVWLSTGFPLLIGFGEVQNQEAHMSKPQSIFERPAEGRAKTQVAEAPGAINTSFEKDFSLLTRAMNDAAVAVYPIDARGMLARMDQALFNFDVKGRLVSGVSETPNHTTLGRIAAETGGKLFFGEEIPDALAKVFEDTGAYYTLAYYPSHSNWDGRFRRIRLKVSRPDVKLSYRQGYYATAEAATGKDWTAEIDDAVRSPVDATAIGIDASLERAAGAAQDALTLVLQVDGKAMAFEPAANGLVSKLVLVVVQRNAEGRQVDGGFDELAINVPQERLQAIRSGVFAHRKALRLHPQAVSLRVVVGQASTRALGSVGIPLATR